MPDLSTRNRWPLWWLALLPLLLGAALFITGLTDTSLWADEGWTIAASAEPDPLRVVSEWVAVDVHPPLFFTNLNLWRLFTGDTILELRYFSVLWSLVGVALAYRIGGELFGGRAGLLAALFYALHDLIAVLTQEVRHYPQQMALALLVPGLYWRFWQRPDRWRGIAFVLGAAALLYTHYWGGFVLLALAVHALMTRTRRLRPFVLAFGGAGLLFAPWLPVLYHQITLERPGGLPHALENSRQVYAVLVYQLAGIPEWLWLILALVGAFGAYAAMPPRYKPSPASLIPLLVAVLPPVLSVLVNTVYPTLSFRSLAVIVPAVILLAAHGLAQFRARERRVVLAFIVIYSLTSSSAQPIERPPWPQIAAYMTQRSGENDVILLENDTDEFALAYYIEHTGTGVDYAHTEAERLLRPASYAAYLDAALDGKTGLWVSKLGWPALADIRPELEARGWVQSAPELDYGMYNDRPILVWRLDRIPDGPPRATFDETLRLLRAEAIQHDDGVTVNLLWSPAEMPAQEYTVSAFLLGPAFANHDSRPLDGLSPTSDWEAGGLYFDSLRVDTAGLPPGEYAVGVQVYSFADIDFSQIVNAPVDDCSADADCRFIVIDTLTLP